MVPLMTKGLPEDLLREDVVLPAQFIERRKRPMTPERRLAFAVLWAAVFDLHKYRFATRRQHQRRYREAYLWVASDDAQWEFSFSRLCEAFEVNTDQARAALLDFNGVAMHGQDPPAALRPTARRDPHESVDQAA